MRRLRSVVVLACVAGASAGCAQDSAERPPRAPADAIPQAVGVAGGQVVEGTARGNIRRTREIDSFTIAKSPVTVGQYRLCTSAGVCTVPELESGFCAEGRGSAALLDGSTWSSGDEELPVTCVSLAQAARFCAWVGGRLPTPAEWQLAARGKDVQRYSWGSAAPTCAQHWRVAFGEEPGASCGDATEARVGRHADGASASGMLDVLSARGEMVAGDAESPWPSCQSAKHGCIATGTVPGAIDAFLPGSIEENAALPAGFRCRWEKE